MGKGLEKILNKLEEIRMSFQNQSHYFCNSYIKASISHSIKDEYWPLEKHEYFLNVLKIKKTYTFCSIMQQVVIFEKIDRVSKSSEKINKSTI